MATTPVDAQTGAELAELDRRHLIHPNLPGGEDERCVLGAAASPALGRDGDARRHGRSLADPGRSRPSPRSPLSPGAQTQQPRVLHELLGSSPTTKSIPPRRPARSELAPEGLPSACSSPAAARKPTDTAIKVARLLPTIGRATLSGRGSSPVVTRTTALAYGSGSATGFDEYHAGIGPMLPHVAHVTPTWPYRWSCSAVADPCDFLLRRAGGDHRAHRPGAGWRRSIGEPIMGVGGVLIPPEDYWPRVRELLDPSRHPG